MFGSEYGLSEGASWNEYDHQEAESDQIATIGTGTITPADIPDGEPEEVVRELRWVRPDGYCESIARFRNLGLSNDTMRKFIALSAGNDTVTAADKFTYFCGCCWRVARQAAGQ